MALQAKWHGQWSGRRRGAPAAFGFGFRTDAGFGLCFSALCAHFAMFFSPGLLCFLCFFSACPSNNVKHLFAHIFNSVQHVIFFINTQAHIYLYLSFSFSLSPYMYVCFLFAFALCITGAVFAQCRRITNCFKYPARIEKADLSCMEIKANDQLCIHEDNKIK